MEGTLKKDIKMINRKIIQPPVTKKPPRYVISVFVKIAYVVKPMNIVMVQIAAVNTVSGV